ncbi:MAG: anthranilate synthase component I family protein [Thermoflexibacter sp.]|nr:anthranilate synthase component I family protein [Thermoflexibacter sp.]
MKTFYLHTASKKLLADTFTPVSIYLKLRDKYINTLLLESSDYHGNENAFTYICCDPIAKFEVKDQNISMQFPDNSMITQPITDKKMVVNYLGEFARSFHTDFQTTKFINNGLFGYMAYQAVQYYEDISLEEKTPLEIPLVLYQVFRFVIAINHFNNELYIFEHTLAGSKEESKIPQIETLIRNKNFSAYHFTLDGEETSNMTDQAYIDMVSKGKYHCQIGDVFQIVLSRRFQRKFKGDDFNVYRALRSINPSPYLFYFDYGSFKIFGSSPETQLAIKNNQAAIYPIAGTFKRTGHDAQDAEMAQKLLQDPKENAEHIMLVDLARNDLSKHCDNVRVTTFKEIQYFSHVIHLVSTIQGELHNQDSAVQIVADTFPAGTLSGAPKHKAMQLIDQYEVTSRNYYGGCIGFMGFNGDFNQAIMIRSFLSQHNTLYYQAGAGIVAKSNEQSELEEVNHKLRALRTALKIAEEQSENW